MVGMVPKYYTEFPEIGSAVDSSRMNVGDALFAAMEPHIQKAFADMAALENGAIANPDENRMVSHYWLRNPALAPTPEIRREIAENISKIKDFSADIHSGVIGGSGGAFKNHLLIGIGGSALGLQFVSNALGDPRMDKLNPFFFDSTDPYGMDRVLTGIGAELNRTLCIVISNSGRTRETCNGMLIAKAAFEQAGLRFSQHTIAVTSAGSQLDKYAMEHNFLARFLMWDWIGGRTSQPSVVGLPPAAHQGFDIDALLAGAGARDEITRKSNVRSNPAVQLTLAWHRAGNGKGDKNMVVLPHKDRLELFSKYLQQLEMESLGKENDLSHKLVNQVISVLWKKGMTEQHLYIQQLANVLNDFFVSFIEVLKEERRPANLVEPHITAGDFLHGFYLGVRQALSEKDRESLSILIKDVSSFSVGVLLALFERTVGLYASLINVNVYHQPGVEAGKKADGNVIGIQRLITNFLKKRLVLELTCEEIVTGIARDEEVETVLKICEHLSANPDPSIHIVSGNSIFAAKNTLLK